MPSELTTRRWFLVAAIVAVLAIVSAGCSADEPSATGTLPLPAATPSVDAIAVEPASAMSDAASSDSQLQDIPGLITLCQQDSDLACDILFHYTDHESDAEAVALACGGRSPATNSFCTAGVDADPPNVWFATDSLALGEIVGACQDGDMVACDFLFVRSPTGSTYERIGLTCGDRTPVASPDCRRGLP